MKPLVRLAATLAMLPLTLTHKLLSAVTTADSSLEAHSQLLSLLPGKTGSYLRNAFYRGALERCAASATFSFGVLLSKTGARIGENVYVGPRCCLGLVSLEADVLLGPGVQIPSGPQTHGTERLDQPIRLQPGNMRRITVGRDSWIGAGCIVLADIGEQSVVGAGSIVTKPTAPRTVSVGNPARPLAERD